MRDDHVRTDEQSLDALDDDDYSPPTARSIAAAQECQARERAAFTTVTGMRLREDGTIDHRRIR